ncbi:MAG: hypothetical protein M1817_005910 [Caeruleum heppii]|nr:MAG: hypothetical protein M1817_005910 [Caeruleum heppii]
MSASDFEAESSRRTHKAPYGPHHPVPTVQRYEKQQHDRQEQTLPVRDDQDTAKEDTSLIHKGAEAVRGLFHKEDSSNDPAAGQPYPTKNLHESTEYDGPTQKESEDQPSERPDDSHQQGDDDDHQNGDESQHVTSGLTDPKQKRKKLHHSQRNHHERVVTDPVTHLPVTIHDTATKELDHVPLNLPPPNESPGSDENDADAEAVHQSVQRLFPPPSFEHARARMVTVYQLGISVGLVTTLAAVLAVSLIIRTFLPSRANSGHDDQDQSLRWLSWTLMVALAGLVLGLGAFTLWMLTGWLENKVAGVWTDEIWGAEKKRGEQEAKSHIPESTEWLNHTLSAVWPLVNPDLFTSLADTLEDVMQASIPKMVRMISVEDLGQGSEALRILGVRWLPRGAAASSVTSDGQLQEGDGVGTKPKDRAGREGQNAQGTQDIPHGRSGSRQDDGRPQGDVGQGQGQATDESGQKSEVAEGMEAEEGEYINLEIAFAYRARASGKGIKARSKNAHLYLVFYLPGGIRFPVWVELRGLVGTLRTRLQLTPDPPFFELMTTTFLGQPKVDLSCVPLNKKGLNIMDLPLISGFVQSSVDAAMAEYVAPKSLTLNLKDMIVGDDFKKDTNAHGIIMIHIKRAQGFKHGDRALGGLLSGSSDAYVAVGWAKFGKPVWTTRVIVDDLNPIWEEMAFVPVGEDELNAEERLKVQLWDSDRTSADDDLGTIEVDLKQLMHSSQTKSKMHDRKDGLQGMNDDETVPGTLEWSVGYYPKVGLLPKQLQQQTEDPEIRKLSELKEKVTEEAHRRLREATDRDESHEFSQQRSQDYKDATTRMIASAPPPEDYPSGVLSIQIHQIGGLELTKLNKGSREADDGSDDVDSQQGEDLPSSYCEIVINHSKVFKTRTKPKNGMPFFNAGTERFIREWRTAEVIISVRDSRVHEDDPLLGVVVLPLRQVFAHRAQVNDHYPLAGGIGHGRVRVSMVFRSVELQAPRELLGWDYGTLEITDEITAHELRSDLEGHRLKIRTSLGKGKMTSVKSGWKGKKDRHVQLAVRKRYSSVLIIEFRKDRLGLDKTPAFAALWLKDIPDDEPRTVSLAVWKASDDNLKRAELCCDADLGEKLGEIEVPVRFWPGLSGYHKQLASKNQNVKDVCEVLDCAKEDKETKGGGTGGDYSDTSESSDSDDDGKGDDGNHDPRQSANGDTHTDGDTAHQHSNGHGPIDQLKDYKDHRSQLHRRHRGLMQWKGARTMAWVKTKAHHAGHRLSGQFNHTDRDTGIETEV